MKLLKIFVPMLLLFTLSTISLVASDDKQETPATTNKNVITWLSLDQGLIKAKELNKHIFIDFTAKWCGYCKKMEKEAFADSTVITLLNNDFIPVKVDGDSQNELDIKGYKITEQNLTRQEFGVTGFPTFWFLTPDGNKLTNLRGYRTTDFMKEALTYIKDYKYDSTKTDPGTGNK